MLVLPIILILVVVIGTFSTLATAFGHVITGGVTSYDEETFQDYANQQYYAEFSGKTENFENNLLIVFLTNKENDGYYAIAWVGDNVEYKINEMLGNEYTAFGRAINESVNQKTYKYSLAQNLSMALDKLADDVERTKMGYGLDSSFKFPPKTPDTYESHVTNYSQLQFNHDTVNLALAEFTARTEIPTVIVVANMEDVLPHGLTAGDIFILCVLGIFLIVAIILIIRAFRKRKKSGGNGGNGNNDGPEDKGEWDGNPRTDNRSGSSYNRNPGSGYQR